MRPNTHGIRARATTLMTAMAAFSAPVAIGPYHDVAPRTTVVIQNGHCYLDADQGGKSFCEDPPVLSAAPGIRLTWLNRSSFAHTITRCTPAACQGLDGGDGSDAFGDRERVFQSGTSYTFSFKSLGTYRYYCRIHGYAAMHGVVVVGGDGSSPSTGASASTGSNSTGGGYGAAGIDGGSRTESTAGPRSPGSGASAVGGGATLPTAANISRTGSASGIIRWLVPVLVAVVLTLVAGLRVRRRNP